MTEEPEGFSMDFSQFTDDEITAEHERRSAIRWDARRAHEEEKESIRNKEWFDAAWGALNAHRPAPEDEYDLVTEYVSEAYAAAMLRHPDRDADELHFVVASAVWGWLNDVDVEDIHPTCKAGAVLYGYAKAVHDWTVAVEAVWAVGAGISGFVEAFRPKMGVSDD